MAAGAAVLLLGGCGAPPAPAPRPPAPELARAARVEDRAVLLMMTDRRFFEPFNVRRILVENPALLDELARALGRIGRPRAVPVLETLLRDPDVEVRRAAAFALGLLGEAAPPPPLLAAAADPDREVGRRAVHALARGGRPLESVLAAVAGLAAEEREPRLLPHLFRFDPAAARARALEVFPEEGPLRAWAAYALARRPLGDSAPHLRPLLSDPDPWVRGWAARALGEVGSAGDLAGLRPLLDDPEAGPTVEVLRAARRLLAAGRAAPPRGWVPRLLELIGDPRPGIRMTAIEASAAWLRSEPLGEALAALAAAGGGRERQLALLALAEGADPRAPELVAAAAAAADPRLRQRAAEAAAELGAGAVLDELAADPEPAVRLAVLAARLRSSAAAAEPFAVRALEDEDPAVRAAALGWLAEHSRVAYERLMAALEGPGARFLVELALEGVDALVARALAEPRERGAIVEVLERMSRGWDYPVRRRAARGLVELDRPEPALGEFETGLDLADYRDLVRRTAAPRTVEIATRHGVLTLRIDCPLAPMTCKGFLQLTNQGFYDGLTFHRVVPNFVVQGGDPRGDGWGGPGYTLRDELSPAPYERGTVGMALSGPDTAGSQFFVTLSRQPHLDGAFTVLGRVIAGDQVLDRIEQGDRMESVREVEEGVGRRPGPVAGGAR